MFSVHLFFCLPLPRLPSVVPCAVSLWLGCLILSGDHTILVFDALQLPAYQEIFIRYYSCMLCDGFPHMRVSDSVFVGDAKDFAEASQL